MRGNFAKPEVSSELQTLGLKLAGAVLLALVNPLSALLPLIDLGDPQQAASVWHSALGLGAKPRQRKWASRRKEINSDALSSAQSFVRLATTMIF